MPGNHDRGGPAAESFSQGRAAWCQDFPEYGLRFICLDSTQPGNEVAMFAWGGVEPEQIEYASTAAWEAEEAGYFPVVLLHHHVLPDENGDGDVLTAVSDALDMPFMRHADNGIRLLARLPGNCLVLHGHKHAAMNRGPVYNAGSTTESSQYRVFAIGGRRVLYSGLIQFAAQWTPEAERAIRGAR